ncbi:hypothetical protein MTBLM1_10306 [Rhodospirillaceae bacterium LM-1]|nr:hypothetical protein MTBLM1_10306 [Rhodospirillaceae bacterium LM-1]
MIGALSGIGGYAALGVSPVSRQPSSRGVEGAVDAKAPESKTESKPESTTSNLANPSQLSEEEQRIVAKLKQREAEVLAHEQAHKAAGGAYAGSPNYTTTQGPDGRRYITGGEVSIDISAEDTPEETIRKMEQIKRAALAPGDPSSQDRAVAMQAEAIKAQAEAQLNEQRQEKLRGDEGGAGGSLTAEAGAIDNESKALPIGPYNQVSRAYRSASVLADAFQGVGVQA